MSEKTSKNTYKRVLLKLSGESLAGDQKTGINPHILEHFIEEVRKALSNDIQIAIVIGGGNIFRGLSQSAQKMDRVTADQMGMLATIINALAIKDAFLQKDIPALVMTATVMHDFAEPFTKSAAIQHLEKGEVVIFGGGTGNPYFTTDTAAVLRAVEIEADVILKGTRVDGVYSADPEKDQNAVKFDSLTYIEVLTKKLSVMDSTAISLSMDNKLPIIVFNFNIENNLHRVIRGEHIGTIVQE